MSEKNEVSKKSNLGKYSLLAGCAAISILSIFMILLIVFVLPPLISGSDGNPTLPAPTITSLSPPTVTDTPQISPSPTSTLTANVTLLLTFSDRLVAAQEDIRLAERSMENSEFEEAILIWDRVIAQVPGYPEAYFQRGVSRNHLLHVHINPEADQLNALKAYDDISRAIELNPYVGEYYVYRSEAAGEIASGEDFWVDTLLWNQVVLEDTIKAVELRSSSPWNNRGVGFALIGVGRCDEAIDYFERLLEAQGDAPLSAGINTGFAYAYNCIGDHEEALFFIYRALILHPDYSRLRYKALIFIHLERYEEALEIYNRLLAEMQGSVGIYYYGRAYIYYKLGEPELALQDIRAGEPLTYGRLNIRAYVLGRLAIDAGDIQSGIEWLQLAEASFFPYSPIYDQIVADLESLGGDYLFPTPAPPLEFASSTIPAISDKLYATPTPPPNLYARTILANYNGLGPFVFQPFDYPVFMFRPSCNPVFGLVKTIVIKLDGGPDGQELPLLLQTIDPSTGGYGNPTNLVFGEQELRVPGRWVDSQGYIYLAIRNTSDKLIVVENIKIRMVITESFGVEKVCGFR